MQMSNMLSDPPEVEYLDGRSYPKVSPKRTHALVQAAFIRVLDRCAAARGEYGPEWRFDLGAVDRSDTEFVPDVGFISYTRLDGLTDAQAEEPPCPPDLAIEIRSPSSRPGLIRAKIARYLKTGATMVLDVDPADRVIHAHTISGVRTYREGEEFSHPSLPWLVFQTAEVFPKPRTRKP